MPGSGGSSAATVDHVRSGIETCCCDLLQAHDLDEGGTRKWPFASIGVRGGRTDEQEQPATTARRADVRRAPTPPAGRLNAVSMQLGRAGGHVPHPRRAPAFDARKRASSCSGLRRSPWTSTGRRGRRCPRFRIAQAKRAPGRDRRRGSRLVRSEHLECEVPAPAFSTEAQARRPASARWCRPSADHDGRRNRDGLAPGRGAAWSGSCGESPRWRALWVSR